MDRNLLENNLNANDIARKKNFSRVLDPEAQPDQMQSMNIV